MARSSKFEEVSDGVFEARLEFKQGGVTSVIVVQADTDEEVLAIAVGPKAKAGYSAQELVFYAPRCYDLAELLADAADILGDRRRGRGNRDSDN
jgi:hypothetical protein